MNLLSLSLKEWRRRPLRTSITACGVAIAVAAMFSLLAFHDGYRDGVRSEIERLGAHVLIVPKGCPYDAASMALHGANWPCYLSNSHLQEIQSIPGIAKAAPAFMAAPGSDRGAPTVYMGIDENMLALRPGWKVHGAFPRASGEILAGAAAAQTHGWKVGDRVLLPELAHTGIVSGILGPTRGSEDSFLYARLPEAQAWFQKTGQLTHVLVKLKDANLTDSALIAMRGCDAGMDMNVVPLTHLFQTISAFVNSTRVLLGCVALIGLLIAASGVSNTVLMSVAERTREIGLMRAMGASRSHVFALVWLETVQVCLAGAAGGIALACLSSRALETWLRGRLPFAPTDGLIRWEPAVAAGCVLGAVVLGSLAALLPASRAAESSPMEALRAGAKL